MAIKNGTVFEIAYAGTLGGDGDVLPGAVNQELGRREIGGLLLESCASYEREEVDPERRRWCRVRLENSLDISNL